MKELKSIDPLSLGKIVAIVNAVMGFLVGLFVTVFSPFMYMWGPLGAAALGLLAIIVFPILFAIIGFITGIIVAFVYNVVAKRFGGVMLDL
ncbi:MAG: hypothetical protein QW286_00190 [Candidatus Aenigmatarchaeota archaeon]